MTTRPDPRRIDRYEPPNYLARYRERQARQTAPASEEGAPSDEDRGTPLYLRRFRSRATAPLREQSVVHLDDAEPFTREYARTTREKEIVAPPELRQVEDFVAEIRIVRHGITQGYSTDAGLTPMGGWQAHQRGHSLSKSLKDGQKVRIVCADTNRARQTAEHIHRGMLDGLEQWQRKADISGPEAIPELRNFGVWTPDGLRDVTSAFRQYQATMEKLERMAVGDRPRWLVEIDRFYRTQLGGADPIYMWMTIPLMYFEPPAMCVRRFWRGFQRLISEAEGPGASQRAPASEERTGPGSRPSDSEAEGPGASQRAPASEERTGPGSRPSDTVSPYRIIAATHSGPMRAFATWAHGYDPGEPYNTEEVVVKVRRGGRTALVAYRNRVTEVNVPPPDEFPAWES